MKRFHTLIFLKKSSERNFIKALEKITLEDQIQIAKESALFLKNNPEFKGFQIRYDALLSVPHRLPKQIENAWHLM